MFLNEAGQKYAMGHLREIQLRRMIQLVREPGVTNYCEIGMNGGHSTVAMLVSNPRVTAHVFDLMRFNYSQPVADLLKMSFGSRFQIHKGYSWSTLPPWVEEFRSNNSRCDLMLVDGGHSTHAARSDMKALRPVAAAKSRVVLDDIQINPGKVLRSMASRGAMEIIETYGPYPKHSKINPTRWVWGFSVATYNLTLQELG